jgi:hypothetical protein
MKARGRTRDEGLGEPFRLPSAARDGLAPLVIHERFQRSSIAGDRSRSYDGRMLRLARSVPPHCYVAQAAGPVGQSPCSAALCAERSGDA